ncbi:hypothetical protein [Tenacibaculum finnmarkense]|uniref:Uncharacterized protein n=1 Tax=Tenacibaculum finnmarkense genomovar finnmarkense TaxID=1458503 RepID=A0AAP1RDN5_9FLAO|nr:hypothetical protein [Tenacibaculum finnmarkense]MBE7652141.1 hypothetical protein [Tenacibaculum finnmarkense genomovar finnmarkense]MBE7694144.1 hypothetical protein [Tenacibaculum finnmarkense genomovar finnmarkense]MCG8730150.1 hypothetical protein [Tenacibaculum finnmarkense]MCG8768883.1 hypothetical protein [Tenacibaculum finnmarkense]MCG8773909.1 hypothetical protein [Tenacibaculum finnmarkense]
MIKNKYLCSVNCTIKHTSSQILVSKARNSYRLNLGYKVIDFTFCQLLAFRKKILDNSSYQALENIIEGDNFILIFVADNKHLLLLDIPQIIELKEALLSAFK